MGNIVDVIPPSPLFEASKHDLGGVSGRVCAMDGEGCWDIGAVLGMGCHCNLRDCEETVGLVVVGVRSLWVQTLRGGEAGSEVGEWSAGA